MKMTRERKIFLGILGAGLLALAGDQLIGPPSPAGASDEYAVTAAQRAPVAASPSLAASSAAPSAASSGASTRSFVVRTRELGATTTGRDPFQPPAPWIAKKIDPSTAVQPTVAERFQKAHRLDAVVLEGREGRAIVSGTAVVVGQTIDGCRLVRVTHDAALFEADGQRIALRLKTADKPTPR
jgi:hypothetical protein